jgi:predicted nucleotidyltransferase
MKTAKEKKQVVLNKQLERVIELAKEYGATRLILFGSAAENLSTARDIDLAVG